MGHRVDAVVLVNGIVLAIEFKIELNRKTCETLEKMAAYTHKPLSAMPNAGNRLARTKMAFHSVAATSS